MARNAPIRNAETTPMEPLTFPSRRRCRIRRRRHSARFEALESRRLLSMFTVNSTADDGSTGTLRWAIGQANSAGGAETIQFDPTVFATPQTITLSGTQLELTDTTGTETITGPAAGLTISGGGKSRVFKVDDGVSASFTGLTITGGVTSTGYGGGLDVVGGSVSLIDCTIAGNSAVRGGGLYLLGSASADLTGCTLSGNSTTRGGGGIWSNVNGGVALTGCTLSGNSAKNGGGLLNYNGTATLSDCTVSGNSVTGNGGGLYTESLLELISSTVSGNSASKAGGGLFDIHVGASLNDTIVAGNTLSSGASDIGGNAAVSGANNLIGTGGSGGLVNGVNGNLVGVTDPGLAPLGDYGGPT